MIPPDIARIIVQNICHQISPVYTKFDAFQDAISFATAINVKMSDIDLKLNDEWKDNYPHYFSYYHESSCESFFGISYSEARIKSSVPVHTLHYFFPHPFTLLNGRQFRACILDIFHGSVSKWLFFYVNKCQRMFWNNTNNTNENFLLIPEWFIEAFLPIYDIYVPWQNICLIYSIFISIYYDFERDNDNIILIERDRSKIIQFIKKWRSKMMENLVYLYEDEITYNFVNECLDSFDEISIRFMCDEISRLCCDNDDIQYPVSWMGKRCKTSIITRKKYKDRLIISNLGRKLIQKIIKNNIPFNIEILKRIKDFIYFHSGLPWISSHLLNKYCEYIIYNKNENQDQINMSELKNPHFIIEALKEKVYGFQIQNFSNIQPFMFLLNDLSIDINNFLDEIYLGIKEKRYAKTCENNNLIYIDYDPTLMFSFDIKDRGSHLNTQYLESMSQLIGANICSSFFGYTEEDLPQIRKMFDRYIVLENYLHSNGLFLYSDSKVCAHYVILGKYCGPYFPFGDLDDPLIKVVEIMKEMRFFFNKTDYITKRKYMSSETSKLATIYEIIKSAEIFSSQFPMTFFPFLPKIDEFPIRIRYIISYEKNKIIEAYYTWQNRIFRNINLF